MGCVRLKYGTFRRVEAKGGGMHSDASTAVDGGKVAFRDGSDCLNEFQDEQGKEAGY
jgi:hypothetical protein